MASVSDREDLLAAIKKRIDSESIEPENSSATLNFTRVPFVITCDKWQRISSGAEYIIWKANPEEVSWTLPQRSSEQKTRLGTILHVWKDNYRNTFYDEPILDITFQSGSIFPVKNQDGKLQINSGLQNFYKFLELVDEDKTNSDGTVNMVHIFYNSVVFPTMVLSGLFSPEGLSWTDSGTDPFNHTWRARFTVRDTYPRLAKNKAVLLKNSFNQAFENIAFRNVDTDNQFVAL